MHLTREEIESADNKNVLFWFEPDIWTRSFRDNFQEQFLVLRSLI